MVPRDSGTTHVAFGAHDGLGLHNVVISWLNPIPHAITVYASDTALPRRPQHSLPGGSLRLTRTGLAPVGSRQLRLAHRLVTPVSRSRDFLPLMQNFAHAVAKASMCSTLERFHAECA